MHVLLVRYINGHWNSNGKYNGPFLHSAEIYVTSLKDYSKILR